jgi:hypothetical protein
MEFQRVNAGAVGFFNVEPLVRDWLLEVPIAADPSDHPGVEARLFSPPVAPEDTALNADWRDYVKPELQRLFQRSIDIFSKDLVSAKIHPDGACDILIPQGHIDHWISSLNQARLAIAARLEFTEAELTADLLPDIEHPRDLALFQVHFFGMLQQTLLDVADDS